VVDGTLAAGGLVSSMVALAAIEPTAGLETTLAAGLLLVETTLAGRTICV